MDSNKDNSKLVKVTLEQARMYRADHTDTTAITVGPGEVEVPAWVAAEWAKPAPTPTPTTNQDDALKVAQARIAELEAELAAWKKPQAIGSKKAN